MREQTCIAQQLSAHSEMMKKKQLRVCKQSIGQMQMSQLCQLPVHLQVVMVVCSSCSTWCHAWLTAGAATCSHDTQAPGWYHVLVFDPDIAHRTSHQFVMHGDSGTTSLRLPLSRSLRLYGHEHAQKLHATTGGSCQRDPYLQSSLQMP